MRHHLAWTASAAVILTATSGACQTADEARLYHIPPGSMESALRAFALQSDRPILFESTVVAGLHSKGLVGSYAPAEALAALTGEAGLHVEVRNDAFIVQNRSPEDSLATLVDDVVVTGSLIRGAEKGPSPVLTIDRDQIDREGYATLSQALAALPQNFGGTANDAASAAGADRTATNATQASGVNLRGLGSDATLVLVNGRRLAGTGNKGDFADISTLPLSAVRRVDVLLDGASAIYGADAVGGVVNVILRDDYDGAETRLRAGATTDGASEDWQFGQTLGRTWGSGSLMGVYEYNQRTALPASARRLAGDADLRWRGGTDHRTTFSNPGNIVRFDPALGAYVVTHAIPRGQDGQDLAPADFRAGEQNLFNTREGLNVLPRQTRHSALAAWRQNLTDDFELSADLRYGRRDFESSAPGFSTTFNVTDANPFFASPIGARSHTLAYNFLRDLGNLDVSGKAESFGASLGADVDLGRTWRMSSYAAYASEDGLSRTDNLVNSTFLSEALGNVADNPATPFSAVRDGYFNPFADGRGSSPAALAFVGSGWSQSRYDTSVSTVNAQMDGVLAALPGGPLQIAFGAAHRLETYAAQTSSFTSGVTPASGRKREYERMVGAAFAELRLPLFGAPNARFGLERLELSLAARYENYSDMGDTTSPKAGVVWAPHKDLTLRGSYSFSYRAPALREMFEPQDASPSFLPRGGRQILSMILYGGNAELEPETADTWSFGGDYQPASVPGLRLGLNAFSTRFDGRIGQPTFENIPAALSDPALSPFVRLLDPINNAADRAAVQAYLDLPTTAFRDAFPATAYGAIVDARFVNTARVEIEGMDVFAAYQFDLGRDTIETGLNLTHISRHDSQATPLSEGVSLIDRPQHPASVRGRAHADWSRGSWSAGLGVSYVAGYDDPEGEAVGSWTTFDAQARYTPATGPLAGSAIIFSVRNLFDRDPPFYDSPQGVGFDAANTDVIGRHASIQLTRAW